MNKKENEKVEQEIPDLTGDELKYIRESSMIKQDQLAGKANLSRRTIQVYENRRRDPADMPGSGLVPAIVVASIMQLTGPALFSKLRNEYAAGRRTSRQWKRIEQERRRKERLARRKRR
ncbi:MAG: helix-turn-helix domain-containing protein [Bacteroidota bacterium]